MAQQIRNVNYSIIPSNLEGYHEVLVSFYHNKVAQKKVIFVKDNNKWSDNDYIKEAKNQFNAKLKEGKVELREKPYKAHKLSPLAISAICLGAVAVSAGGYFAYRYFTKDDALPKGTPVDVKPEINDPTHGDYKVEFSKDEAKVGEDYTTTITLTPKNDDKKYYVLPEKLDKVVSYNTELNTKQYTYKLGDNKMYAELEIKGKFVFGEVKVTLTLKEGERPVPPTPTDKVTFTGGNIVNCSISHKGNPITSGASIEFDWTGNPIVLDCSTEAPYQLDESCFTIAPALEMKYEASANTLTITDAQKNTTYTLDAVAYEMKTVNVVHEGANCTVTDQSGKIIIDTTTPTPIQFKTTDETYKFKVSPSEGCKIDPNIVVLIDGKQSTTATYVNGEITISSSELALSKTLITIKVVGVTPQESLDCVITFDSNCSVTYEGEGVTSGNKISVTPIGKTRSIQFIVNTKAGYYFSRRQATLPQDGVGLDVRQLSDNQYVVTYQLLGIKFTTAIEVRFIPLAYAENYLMLTETAQQYIYFNIEVGGETVPSPCSPISSGGEAQIPFVWDKKYEQSKPQLGIKIIDGMECGEDSMAFMDPDQKIIFITGIKTSGAKHIIIDLVEPKGESSVLTVDSASKQYVTLINEEGAEVEQFSLKSGVGQPSVSFRFKLNAACKFNGPVKIIYSINGFEYYLVTANADGDLFVGTIDFKAKMRWPGYDLELHVEQLMPVKSATLTIGDIAALTNRSVELKYGETTLEPKKSYTVSTNAEGNVELKCGPLTPSVDLNKNSFAIDGKFEEGFSYDCFTDTLTIKFVCGDLAISNINTYDAVHVDTCYTGSGASSTLFYGQSQLSAGSPVKVTYLINGEIYMNISFVEPDSYIVAEESSIVINHEKGNPIPYTDVCQWDGANTITFCFKTGVIESAESIDLYFTIGTKK